MDIKASATYLRIIPRKLRLLSQDLLGLGPKEAIVKLSFFRKQGGEYLQKAIKQATANAVNNFKLNESDLKIKSVEITDGPRMKRMDRSHGARFDRGIIKKRMSHIYVTLDTKNKEGVIRQASKKKKVINKKEKHLKMESRN